MVARLRDAVQRGTNAARPAATAVDVGTLYYDTTNSIMTRSNGTTWDNVGETTSAALTVEERDASPSVSADKIIVPNGALIDAGSGDARLIGMGILGAYNIEDASYTDAGFSDEFTAGTLDAQWTAVGVSGTGTVDLSQTNIADSIYDLATRAGTLMVQIDQSDMVGFRIDGMIANDEQIVVSMGMPYPLETTAGGTNNGFRAGICVNDNDTSYASGTYHAVAWDGTDVSRVIHFQGATIYGESTTGAIAGGRFYTKMWRASDVLHFAWSKDGTVWSYLGSVSVTGFVNIWLFMDCSQAAGTDNAPIIPVFWVRHVANTNYDPW